MNNTQRITGLLHELRSPTASLDLAHELATALHNANYDECKVALMEFTMGLLKAHRSILNIQIDANNAADERDAGSLQ